MVGEHRELIAAEELLDLLVRGPVEVQHQTLDRDAVPDGVVDNLARRGAVARHQRIEEPFDQNFLGHFTTLQTCFDPVLHADRN